MDGAIDELQKYLRRNNLPLSTVEPLYGAPREVPKDQKNYITMSQALDLISKYRDQYPKGNILPFGKLDEFEEIDKLYFDPFEEHIFIILYLHKKRLAYIADGGNLFKLRNLAYEIKRYLNTTIRFRFVPFYQQKRIDHCGSSAILIAREFLRHYIIGKIPKRLNSIKRLSERLRVKLHTETSEQLERAPAAIRLAKFECRQCSKKYSSRRQCNLHEYYCKRRQ